MQAITVEDLLYRSTFMVQEDEPEPNGCTWLRKSPGLAVQLRGPAMSVVLLPVPQGTRAETSAELALSTPLESTDVTT